MKRHGDLFSTCFSLEGLHDAYLVARKGKRFVRRHSLHRFGRALRAGRTASLNSLMGHALRTSTHRHYCRRIRAERPDLIHSLPLYEAAT